jgi:hypothetical protein
MARATQTVLRIRGISMDDATRLRIEGCTEPVLLERWLSRATTVSTAAELFLDG